MLTFDQTKHEYRWNGVKVPAVSNALDLLYGRFYSQDQTAADNGTYIHGLCQQYLISFNRQLSTRLEFTEFVKWCDLEKITPFETICPEDKFYSCHGYAGTRDLVLDDRKWIIDFKTGQPNEKRDSLQLMAYADEGKARLSNLYWSGEKWYLVDRKFDKGEFRKFLCAVIVLHENKQF